MANSHHTIATFNATVTDGVSEGYGSANYGVSPAPGFSTGASFRFREDAQKCADELNAEYAGDPISDESIFDGIFGDYPNFDRVSGDTHERFAVWTDQSGINITGIELDVISLSDTAAKILVEKLNKIIDQNEVK